MRVEPASCGGGDSTDQPRAADGQSALAFKRSSMPELVGDGVRGLLVTAGDRDEPVRAAGDPRISAATAPARANIVPISMQQERRIILARRQRRVAMAFPDNLRRTRLGQFLSQAELARRSGVHALTITRLESGRTAPSTRTVRALAQALGIAPGELATPEEVAKADRRSRSPSARRGRD